MAPPTTTASRRAVARTAAAALALTLATAALLLLLLAGLGARSLVPLRPFESVPFVSLWAALPSARPKERASVRPKVRTRPPPRRMRKDDGGAADDNGGDEAGDKGKEGKETNNGGDKPSRGQGGPQGKKEKEAADASGADYAWAYDGAMSMPTAMQTSGPSQSPTASIAPSPSAVAANAGDDAASSTPTAPSLLVVAEVRLELEVMRSSMDDRAVEAFERSCGSFLLAALSLDLDVECRVGPLQLLLPGRAVPTSASSTSPEGLQNQGRRLRRPLDRQLDGQLDGQLDRQQERRLARDLGLQPLRIDVDVVAALAGALPSTIDASAAAFEDMVHEAFAGNETVLAMQVEQDANDMDIGDFDDLTRVRVVPRTVASVDKLLGPPGGDDIQNIIIYAALAVGLAMVTTFVYCFYIGPKGRHRSLGRLRSGIGLGSRSGATKATSSKSIGEKSSTWSSLLRELEEFEDFDPEEEDDDVKTRALWGKGRTERLLDATIRCLEALEEASASELEREMRSEEQVRSQEAVARRPVLTEHAGIDGGVGKGSKGMTGEVTKAAAMRVKAGKRDAFEGALEVLRELRRHRTRRDRIGYATYPRHPEFPNVDLSGAMKMMDGPPPLNQFWSPRKLVRYIRRSLEAEATFEILGGEDAVDNAETREAAYEACFARERLFGILPAPHDIFPKPWVVEHWEKDKEFARQFLCGVNPVMIEVVRDLGQLSDNMVGFFGRDRLRGLVNEKRLFFVSYDDLADLEVNPHKAYPLPTNEGARQDQELHFYAPIVALVLDEGRRELDVLGIQLERTPNARVYTRDNSGENEWLFAKTCVASADAQMHEWVSHLGRTHLAMEPHIIAIYNTLRKARHPLYALLRPLCKDTLLLNWVGRRSLVSYGPKAVGDYQLSVGVGQCVQLVEKMWKRYDFFGSGLPSELARRGFDEEFDMPGYLYRDDGMKLWNAYGEFARDFVDEIYPTNEAVATDEAIQVWAAEASDPSRGAIPGFPLAFEDKDTLARALHTLMWIPALHATVNNPQYDYYAYAPNRPLAMRASLGSLPEIDSDIRPWMFQSMLPHISSGDAWLKENTASGRDATLDVIKLFHNLTLGSENCVDNLAEHFGVIGKHAYAKFVQNLDQIGDQIEERNRQDQIAGKAIYPYLNPSLVSASIDI